MHLSSASLNPADIEKLPAEECIKLAEDTRESGVLHVCALMAIRDKRHYAKVGFRTFEAFCEERLGYSKRHANRLITLEEVREEVGPIGPKFYPDSQVPEAHAREAAKLPKGERADAIAEAAAKSGGKPTAKAIKEVVNNRLAAEDPDAVKDALGSVVTDARHIAMFGVAPQQKAAARGLMDTARHVEQMREANPLIGQDVAEKCREAARGLTAAMPYCLTPDWPNVGQKWKDIGVITKDQYERGKAAQK